METASHDEQEPTTWTTKVGQVLTIKFMTTAHLWNVLRMLDRNELAAFSSEFGEHIAEAWEKHDSRPVPNSHPAYAPIVKELHKRGEITYEEMNETFGWEGVD